MITITRYHDISAGHRVAGHESKCKHLHGHNYRVHFTCEAEELDDLGRVMDFSAVKERLCMWLERNWDHQFLAWDKDAYMLAISANLDALPELSEGEVTEYVALMWGASICWTPFNPTAENMARHLVEEVGPRQLEGTGVVLTSVTIDETRKCSATYTLKRHDPLAHSHYIPGDH